MTRALAPGARGIEEAAHNPQCRRRAALLLTGMDMEAAVRLLGGTPLPPSPIATAYGMQFEALLLSQQAYRLRRLLVQRQELASMDTRPLIVDAPSASRTLEDQARLTRKAIWDRCHEEHDAPDLIIHGRLALFIAGSPYWVQPDLLLWTPEGFRVGDIKVFPDRGTRTDPQALRHASRQIAIGALALQALTGKVVSTGSLILTRPGSLFPTLRTVLIAPELADIQRGLQVLEEAHHTPLTAAIGPEGTGADAATLRALPPHYRSDCGQFCSLASICRTELGRRGDPQVLGSRFAALCGDRPVSEVVALLAEPARSQSLQLKTLADLWKEVHPDA